MNCFQNSDSFIDTWHLTKWSQPLFGATCIFLDNVSSFFTLARAQMLICTVLRERKTDVQIVYSIETLRSQQGSRVLAGRYLACLQRPFWCETWSNVLPKGEFVAARYFCSTATAANPVLQLLSWEESVAPWQEWCFCWPFFGNKLMIVCSLFGLTVGWSLQSPATSSVIPVLKLPVRKLPTSLSNRRFCSARPHSFWWIVPKNSVSWGGLFNFWRKLSLFPCMNEVVSSEVAGH